MSFMEIKQYLNIIEIDDLFHVFFAIRLSKKFENNDESKSIALFIGISLSKKLLHIKFMYLLFLIVIVMVWYLGLLV